MFSVALSVASCLRAGTEVHVAWVLSAQNLPGLEPGDAVALTPGGGRMGALGGGMLDMAEGRGIRIGHLGDLNDPMILGALGGAEVAMRHLGIDIGTGALDAAIASLAAAD